MNLVAGLGATGQSVMRYLQVSGEPMLGFDTRADWDISALQAEYPDVHFATGEIPKTWHKWITRIVLSPGICRLEPWVQDFQQRGVEVVGDIELFARAVSQPVVAITGSNGKSTVTTLVGEFLTEAGMKVGVGGNIGCPALDLLMDCQEYDAYVLELSSFQLETTYSLHCAASTVLNITQDHMDRYSGLEAYIQAKTNIYNDTELAVVPLGYEKKFWLTSQMNQVFFGLQKPMDSRYYGVFEHNHQAWLGRGDQAWFPVESMAVQAAHHQLNALAAMALCQPFDIEPAVFEKVLSEFSGLPHRTQLVARQNGVQWIDDSKGTNVGATATAIESLGQSCQDGGRVVLLAGGVGKDADFNELAPVVSSYVKTAILFGADADKLAQALQSATRVEQVDDLQQAIELAKQIAECGDVVLLSPACASFDQFKNYQDRGEKFSLWVKQALEIV